MAVIVISDWSHVFLAGLIGLVIGVLGTLWVVNASDNDCCIAGDEVDDVD